MATEQSSFEQVLESDMKTLAAEIKGQRERPEMKGAAEQELLKEAIRAFPSTERREPSSAPSTSPLPAYAQDAPAETKLEIEYLMELALREGLGRAINEAKKSPYFVQDALHDALAGKLYPELKKRGIVK